MKKINKDKIYKRFIKFINYKQEKNLSTETITIEEVDKNSTVSYNDYCYTPSFYQTFNRQERRILKKYYNIKYE